MVDLSFSKTGYSNLLKIAIDNGYKFCLFDNYKTSRDKVCVLRHDIDADLDSAIQLAEIEKELGINSTYFLMTRSSVYNLFSKTNSDYVKRIIELGHSIGLHYDASFDEKSSNEVLEKNVEFDCLYLKHIFGQDIKVVSFHQPDQRILSNSIVLTNLINTYDKVFLSDLHYISDSNMVWKQNHPGLLFLNREYDRIQVLIHPIWWARQDEIKNTSTIWDEILLKTMNRTQSFLRQTEGAYPSPKNFDYKS